ncbi:MAG: AMP-binding protein [Bacteroidetes bacterium]|nr:AMP-binding protein [Bacteroidota bacterium]
MTDSLVYTFPALFSESVKNFGDRGFIAMVGEKPRSYNETRSQVMALIALFERMEIQPGDRVAILGTNMPNWVVSFLATTFMGAVVVPLLPDFLPKELENILEHSGAKAIVASDNLWQKLNDIATDNLLYRIGMEDFSVEGPLGKKFTFDPLATPVKEYQVKEDDLAGIIYTSGTMGTPKGVMLTHRNISFTAVKSRLIQPIDETDRFLSILPLSHTYENTIGFILPMLSGASIYFLGKTPTPALLLPALLEVKPTLMLSVPLIMEKIFRNKILPAFQEKWAIRMLYRIPVMRKTLHRIAGKKLMETFGGEIKFFGIGGAKLDKTVEQFLIEARFPYAIGYGLTETAPLLAGANPQKTKHQSTGPAMDGVMLKINNPDPVTGEGEIWAKGPNVMVGYFKEPVLTKTVFSEDGWFKTGDLGVFDKDNFLYIKGRLKNMILGANGENIYPEEIESVINNFRFVVESLVVQKKGKLVAMVHFNQEEIALRYLHMKEDVSAYVENMIEELIIELQDYVNSRVNKFSRVQVVILQPVPFSKTPTQKIKRFLYT